MTARKLIGQSVAEELARIRTQSSTRRDLVWLSEAELQVALHAGSARFGLSDEAPQELVADLALRAAFEAFGDGLILMFVDGCQVRELDEPVEVVDSSHIRYVRVRAQRGR